LELSIFSDSGQAPISFLCRVIARKAAGLSDVIEKSHHAYMVLLMLRQFDFIPDRSNGGKAGNAN